MFLSHPNLLSPHVPLWCTYPQFVTFYSYYFTIECTTICLFIFCSRAAAVHTSLGPFVVSESKGTFKMSGKSFAKVPLVKSVTIQASKMMLRVD